MHVKLWFNTHSIHQEEITVVYLCSVMASSLSEPEFSLLWENFSARCEGDDTGPTLGMDCYQAAEIQFTARTRFEEANDGCAANVEMKQPGDEHEPESASHADAECKDEDVAPAALGEGDHSPHGPAAATMAEIIGDDNDIISVKLETNDNVDAPQNAADGEQFVSDAIPLNASGDAESVDIERGVDEDSTSAPTPENKR